MQQRLITYVYTRVLILIMMLLTVSVLILSGCSGSPTNNNPVPTPLPVPAAPGAPTLAVADQQITVSWTAVANATSYQVFYAETNDNSKSMLVTAVTAPQCIINGLTDGTTYYVWIKAENSSGTSGYSPATHATPVAPLTKPYPPLSVSLTPGSQQLSVSWLAVSGATSYQLWFSTSNNSSTAQQTGGAITNLSYNITGLINGVTYYVWVKAKNSLGVSDFSQVAVGTVGGVQNYLSVNVFDAATNQPLANVTLAIPETGQNVTVNNNYQALFYNGCYTLYLSKPGYLTKGLEIDFEADLSANIYLNPVPVTQSYENIAGELEAGGVGYPGLFNLCVGNQSNINFMANILDPQGNFSITSVCDNQIVLAAYTMSADSIAQITYLKTSLQKGYPLTNQLLQLPANPVNYSGTKPGSDCLVVKVNGYTLAQQNSTESNYSFGVGLLAGDSISLESSQTLNNANYFTCQNAGGTGGTCNLQYPDTVPNFTVTASGNNYLLTFTPVNFASYYEVYAIQINGGQATVPFETLVLSGTGLSIPTNLFNFNADSTLLYLRAVQLNNFNLNSILNGTQSYANYSFTEQSATLTLSSGGASLTRPLTLSMKTNLKPIRTKYQLNKLFIK